MILSRSSLSTKWVSRIPNVTIGGYPFSELYPNWEDVLIGLEQAVYDQVNPDPVSGVPKTPRAYLADENRFLNFFF